VTREVNRQQQRGYRRGRQHTGDDVDSFSRAARALR
jgi:hypothetical protein